MEKTNTIGESGEARGDEEVIELLSSIVLNLSVCRIVGLNFKNQPIQLKLSAHHFGSVSEGSQCSATSLFEHE